MTTLRTKLCEMFVYIVLGYFSDLISKTCFVIRTNKRIMTREEFSNCVVEFSHRSIFAPIHAICIMLVVVAVSDYSGIISSTLRFAALSEYDRTTLYVNIYIGLIVFANIVWIDVFNRYRDFVVNQTPGRFIIIMEIAKAFCVYIQVAQETIDTTVVMVQTRTRIFCICVYNTYQYVADWIYQMRLFWRRDEHDRRF